MAGNMMQHPAVALNQLEQLLDDVQRAVMAGKLGDLAEMTTKIESLLPRLSGLVDPAVGRMIKAKAERNAACILASARGVRAARRRLTEVMAAKAGFSTYNNKGHRAAAPDQPRQLTRRV